MMNKLYIIGNGFDMHHGIESGYWHFRSYVEKNDPDLYKTLEEYFNEDELWSDFESALAHLDIDLIREHAINYLESYATEKWRDAYHHDYQFEIDKIVRSASTMLKLRFTEWILQLKMPDRENIIHLDIPKNAIYLVFNYTESLQKFYFIEEKNILYIHNKATDKNSNLILGHSWKPTLPATPKILSLEEQENLGDEDPRVSEGEEILNSYFEKTYKPTKKVISENKKFFSGLTAINEIYIFGHSLSDVDLGYFREIVKNINIQTVKWNVSYYNKVDIAKYKKALINIGVKENNMSFARLTDFLAADKNQTKLNI